MYELVNDIESYPQFLPLCSGAAILHHEEDRLTASVSLATGRLQHTFTTENTMQPGHRIDVRLLSGPFRYLHGYWTFADTGEGQSRIELEMQFEFKNRLLKLALSPIFSQFLNSLVKAFAKRAQAIYGR